MNKTININEFIVAFKFMQHSFEFNVNNSEVNTRVSELLKQFWNWSDLLQSQVISSKAKEPSSTTWMQILKELFLKLDSVIGKVLSVFGITWACESTF